MTNLVIRKLGRAVVMIAIPLTVLGVSPVVASASPTVAPAQQQVADYTPDVDRTWWGKVRIRFNKEQTELIVAGAGAYIGGRWAKVLGTIVGWEVLQTMAQQAVDRGNCLQVDVPPYALVPGVMFGRVSTTPWDC